MGNNWVVFDSSVPATDIAILRKGNDLYISDTTTGDHIRVHSHFSSSSYQLSGVRFADGTEWNSAELDRRLSLTSSDFQDDIQGSNQADTLQGKGGADLVYGHQGDDTLHGDAGDDTVYGGYGDDHLHGGTGDDTLAGQQGADTYYFGANFGRDVIASAYTLDSIVFSSALHSKESIRLTRSSYNLVISFDGLQDQLTLNNYFSSTNYQPAAIRFADGTEWTAAQLEANYAQTGTDGDDTFGGADVAETLKGGQGDDRLYGGNNDDRLEGEQGADTLYGDAGSDTLLGGSGQDKLYGGTGEDRLDGGTGDDTLDGQSGADTYVFGDNFGQDVITRAESHDGIEFTGSQHTKDNIVLYRSSYNLIISFAGSDDQVTLNNYFSGTSYQPAFVRFADGTQWTSTELELNYAMNGSDGADTFGGVNSNENLSGGKGDDTLYGQYGDDQLSGDEGDDKLYGGHDNDQLLGGAGDDTLLGDYGDDVLQGGAGHDELQGGYGNDQVQGGAGNDNLTAGYGDDRLEGGAGDDKLHANYGTNVLIGGEGDDTLYAGTGSDRFVFSQGFGQDTIESTQQGVNWIEFDNTLTTEHIRVYRSGNELIVRDIRSDDSITVKYHFYSASYNIDGIRFADGTEWNAAEIENQIANGQTDGDDLLVGTDNAQTQAGGAGDDRIEGRQGDDTLQGDAGHDTLKGEDGNDTLIGGTGKDTLEGGAGNDEYHYRAGDGRDTIHVGGGSDTLVFDGSIQSANVRVFRSSNDLVILTGQLGDSIVVKSHFSSSTYRLNAIQFADASQWNYTDIANRLAVVDTDGTVVVNAVSGSTYTADVLGSSLSGTNDDDTLVSGSWNDTLNGNYGNDTYRFSLGFGNDKITQSTSANEIDTVVFDSSIQASDIRLSRSGHHLVITHVPTGDEVLVNNHFYTGRAAHTSYAIDKITFEADGTEWDQATMTQIVLTGSDSNDSISGFNDAADIIDGGAGNDTVRGYDGDDTVVGGSGDDTVYGDSGDDVLVGGTGDDTLSGGYGQDTYRFSLGFGKDT
ncbi:hypothetical protein NH399_25225, partial [Pleionea sp. CnH1-48]|nr:hypothetical protein [Pleionea sp. CnH1-48]